MTEHHYYLSTACLHEHHKACRQTCKFCPSRCLCPCHLTPKETP